MGIDKSCILFSHETALAYWRSCGRVPSGLDSRSVRSQAAHRRASKIIGDRISPDSAEADSFREVLLSLRSRDVDVRAQGLEPFDSQAWCLHAVGTAHSREFEACGLKRHCPSRSTSRFPAGAFVAVDEGFLLASPALCYLQLAGSLSVSQAVLLGLELCGTASPRSERCLNDVRSPKGNRRQAPLARPSDLRCMVDSLPGVHGRKIAARALRFVVAGSASPMESALCTMLSLPYSLGGCSLPLPELNYRIDIPRSQQAVFGRTHYRCDLYWPGGRVCVEYDSDMFHTGSERIARDSKRRNALLSMGISVVTVTKRQLMSDIELDEIARTVAALLGKRFRPPEGYWRKRSALRAELRDVLSLQRSS